MATSCHGGSADKKTRDPTKGTVKAVQAMHGDSFSASRVDPGPNTNSTSFGVKVESLALPCSDDVVAENGAAAPKSCLSPMEMRATSAARWFTSPPQNLYSNKDHL